MQEMCFDWIICRESSLLFTWHDNFLCMLNEWPVFRLTWGGSMATSPQQIDRGGPQTPKQISWQNSALRFERCSASLVCLQVESWLRRRWPLWGSHAVVCRMLNHLERRFAGSRAPSPTSRDYTSPKQSTMMLLLWFSCKNPLISSHPCLQKWYMILVSSTVWPLAENVFHEKKWKMQTQEQDAKLVCTAPSKYSVQWKVGLARCFKSPELIYLS